MKVTCLLLAALGLALNAHAAETPARGRLVEQHSCELYTGGCIASSEVTLQGKISVTAWEFTGGTQDGVELKGARAALLQVSKENLATSKAASEAVLYLPTDATEPEHAALTAWVKREVPNANIKEVRAVPISLTGDGVDLAFGAGDNIKFQGAALLPCGLGSCGESLWYQPQASADLFTVGMTEMSNVFEDVLQVKWQQAGQRNLFVGTFDKAKKSAAQYTSCESLCPAEVAAR